MITISNNELNKLKKVGKKIKCSRCGEKHTVTFGMVNGKKSKVLGFVKCGDNTYLISVGEKALEL